MNSSVAERCYATPAFVVLFRVCTPPMRNLATFDRPSGITFAIAAFSIPSILFSLLVV